MVKKQETVMLKPLEPQRRKERKEFAKKNQKEIYHWFSFALSSRPLRLE